jgi:hypothetical protein
MFTRVLGHRTKRSARAMVPKMTLIIIAVVFVVTIVGGYCLNWSWTGFGSNDTLWDWLNLVLLPVTIAFLPVWLITRSSRERSWHIVLSILFVLLIVTIMGGYGYNWRWTGYQGNTLWDWIKLLFVPTVIPLLAVWLQQEQEAGDSAVSSSESGGGSQTTASTSTTVKSSQDIAADTAAARAASLRLSDFPAGWIAEPSNSDPEKDNALMAQLAKFLGVSVRELSDAPVSYDSADFSDTNDLTASSSVDYRATAAEQNRSFELLTGLKTPDCLATTLSNFIDEQVHHPSNSDDTLPAGATVGRPTVSALAFPQFGDKSAAYRVAIPFSYEGLTITPLLDEVFVIKGRASVTMSFQSNESPFPIFQQQHYTGLVVNRLTNT